jgi:hypothetical protein
MADCNGDCKINTQTFQLIRDDIMQVRKGQREVVESVEKYRADLNGRLRKLEQWRAVFIGVGIALSTAISVIGFMVKFLK